MPSDDRVAFWLIVRYSDDDHSAWTPTYAVDDRAIASTLAEAIEYKYASEFGMGIMPVFWDEGARFGLEDDIGELDQRFRAAQTDFKPHQGYPTVQDMIFRDCRRWHERLCGEMGTGSPRFKRTMPDTDRGVITIAGTTTAITAAAPPSAMQRITDRMRGHKAASPEPPNPPADGPIPPNQFAWRGEIATLQPKATALLAAIWNAPHRRIKIEDAADQVWGEDVTDDAIDAAKGKANAALLELGYPGSITKNSGMLILD